MGELISELVDAGLRPRVMLEYSGTLLHELRRMGADDVLDALRAITVDGRYRGALVAGLYGSGDRPWRPPSTPVQDYALHVRAWQQHFAAPFGLEALGRVRGFRPRKWRCPTILDVAYAYVRTLVDAGYRWVLVREHTVEQSDGQGRAISTSRTSCRARAASRPGSSAPVKTQGSDTK